MKNKVNVLEPKYFSKFNCIGSNCEDSCCIGWAVTIDKKTYKKYKDTKDKEFKKIFSSKLSRNRKFNSDNLYGNINMEQDGRCPFLDNKNLCEIHSKLGENNLSTICKTYPRDANRVDSAIERSLTMSCPEAARICLQNPDVMEFEYIQKDMTDDLKPQDYISTEDGFLTNQTHKYFWEIRTFSIAILQDRRYLLSERLIILGILYKKIQDLIDKGSVESVSKTIEKFKTIIDDKSLKKDIENIPSNIKVQMSIANELSAENSIAGISSTRYIECVEQTILGLGGNNQEDMENTKRLYNEGYEKYYVPYIKEKEYILENYLVNEYFRTLMPFGRFETIWDSYVFLCALYSTIKLHMIGIGMYRKKIDDEVVIKLIQSFSKTAIHNAEYVSYIIDILKKNNYDTLTYMAILLKN